MSPDVPDEARPRLARGVRLREDTARGCTVLLAPERVLRPSPTALAALGLCDGERTVAKIADELALLYAAPRERIAADIRVLLADLAAQKVITL